MNLKDLLRTLSDLHGPSGYETPVRQAVAEVWRPLVNALETGRLGSLVGYKYGSGDAPRRRIMLCAHMDEIALIVREVERGFLRIGKLNGVDNRNVTGKPVVVHTAGGPLRGVIGLRPLHTQNADQSSRYPTFDEMFVDVGLPPDEVAARVSIGDPITLDTPLIELNGGRLAGKALDNRASIVAVTACLEALQTRSHIWDVLAVGTVQEEVGSHGARTEAFRLQPDLALAIDVVFATQPGVTEGAYKMGDGPPLSLGANFHPALYEAINAAAARLELTLPADPMPANSGTDAWPVQISRDGIPTALLNIQIRNMHSSVETVDMKDIERAGRVMAEFIAGLTPDFLTTILWDKEKEAAR